MTCQVLVQILTYFDTKMKKVIFNKKFIISVTIFCLHVQCNCLTFQFYHQKYLVVKSNRLLYQHHHFNVMKVPYTCLTFSSAASMYIVVQCNCLTFQHYLPKYLIVISNRLLHQHYHFNVVVTYTYITSSHVHSSPM